MDELTMQASRAAEPRSATTLGLIESGLVLLLVFGLLIGVLAILRPFVEAILFGATLAIAAWPFRETLVRHGLGPTGASLLLLLISLVVIALPVLWLAPRLSEQLTLGFHAVQDLLKGAPRTPDWIAGLPVVGERLAQVWSDAVRAGGDFGAVLAPFSERIRTALLSMAGAAAESLFQILLSLVVATMRWRNGTAIREELRQISYRLGGQVAVDALMAAGGAVRSVAYGVVGTAVAQAVTLAIGLALAGVPGAAGLGFITLVLAASQILAPLLAVIWAGAAWWLFHQGESGWGFFMIGWGVMVSVMDNLLKPWLIGLGVSMPMSLTLLGVFGGFIAFGFLGFFIGPTLIAVAYILLQAWRRARLSGALAEPPLEQN